MTVGEEWRRGWKVVLAAFAGGLLSPMHLFSLGVMIAPLEAEFGWTRAFISTGLVVVSILSVVLAPFLGMAIDRLGARRMAITGCVLYCLGLAAVSTASGSHRSWWLPWSLVGLGFAFITPPVWTAGVSSLFTTSRGLAMSLAMCGSAFGTGLAPVIAALLLERYGWRDAYRGIALLGALVVLPLVLLFFSSASDRQRGAEADGVPPAALPGYTAREGFRSARFYLLALGGVMVLISVGAPYANMVPILKTEGMTLGAAAAIAGLLGIGTLIGRFSIGLVIDRTEAKHMAALAAAMPAGAGLLLILAHGSVLLSSVAVFALGFTIGAAMNIIAYLSTRHYGLRAYGTLYGTFSGLLALMNGVVPMIANWVYDLTRSYQPVLWAMIPTAIIASLFFLSLPAYPDFEEIERQRAST
jgi:MFS family permease